MKKILSSAIFYLWPLFGFGAAGIIDRYNNYVNWLMDAYKYCLILGIICIIVFILSWWKWKDFFDFKFKHFNDYLKTHPTVAIIVLGICFSVIFGIITGVTNLGLGILNIITVLVFLFLIPFLAI